MENNGRGNKIRKSITTIEKREEQMHVANMGCPYHSMKELSIFPGK